MADSRTAVVGAGRLADCLDLAAKSFAPGELAYLALTSKVERPLQDRLAWCLHTQFPSLVVSREWRATDIAILSADAMSPLVLLEAKAMYSFDIAWEHHPAATRYPELMRNDLAKAHQLDQHGTADVYALGLVTHPLGMPRELPGVIKYLGSIKRALSAADAAELRRLAAATMGRALPALGPVRSGSLSGGIAFGVEVAVDYWLVGPCAAPERPS